MFVFFAFMTSASSSFVVLLLLLACVGCSSQHTALPRSSQLIKQLRYELGYLGARNWVVIAESAFPIASRRGLRVISVDAEILPVLKSLDEVLNESHALEPRIFLPAELHHLEYDYAPGIESYRRELDIALKGRETVDLDFKALNTLVESTSKSYRVLVLKTKTSLPYSSVFIELGSGYWDADSEEHLRRHIETREPSLSASKKPR